MGTRKSGRAISVAKEGLFVMRRAGRGMGPAGGWKRRGYMCVCVSMLAVCVTEQQQHLVEGQRISLEKVSEAAAGGNSGVHQSIS